MEDVWYQFLQRSLSPFCGVFLSKPIWRELRWEEHFILTCPMHSPACLPFVKWTNCTAGAERRIIGQNMERQLIECFQQLLLAQSSLILFRNNLLHIILHLVVLRRRVSIFNSAANNFIFLQLLCRYSSEMHAAQEKWFIQHLLAEALGSTFSLRSLTLLSVWYGKPSWEKKPGKRWHCPLFFRGGLPYISSFLSRNKKKARNGKFRRTFAQSIFLVFHKNMCIWYKVPQFALQCWPFLLFGWMNPIFTCLLVSSAFSCLESQWMSQDGGIW